MVNFRKIIEHMNQNKKAVHVTASTGIARLHFKGGETLHHWSSYGDGHLPVDQLIQEVMISNIYESCRKSVKECEVLVIDEIGMISSKMFTEVELLCRTIKCNNNLFGGIQVIGCGSFLQLPPVPSILDQGKYAFESEIFKKIFPHKINLTCVHRQKELDFIRAINDVCEGNPNARTHQLLLTLKRPIDDDNDNLHIFGTNYEVDFYNYMKLQQMAGVEQLFTSEDCGDKIRSKQIGANKYLLLKPKCKAVVTRNLYNGLVNGLGGTITHIGNEEVKFKVDMDNHLKHSLQGKEFTINKYSFVLRDQHNSVVAVRKQLPLKLGYAVTVDKSQGRTLDAVVVDSTNFWRPGQFGVAIGRATSKDALQIETYNKQATFLQHPQIVRNFYMERSLAMRQDLLCCNKATVTTQNFLTYKEPTTQTLQNENLEMNASDYLDKVHVQTFPFDVTEYLKDLRDKIPKVTHIQMEQLQIIQDSCDSAEFKQFLGKAYSVIADLFNKYKIAEKKTKCNWCKLCAHMHMIFTSARYKEDVLKAFKSKSLKSNENAICTRIYFNLLEIIVAKEATVIKQTKIDEMLNAENTTELQLDSLDKSSLRYIAGACIHHVREKLEKLTMNSPMSFSLRSQLNHRKHQLTSKLIGPPQLIEKESCEPESFSKILEKDYGGLLYVTDDTFCFFKLLMLKLSKQQNLLTLQYQPDTVFTRTFNSLITDIDLLECWFNLFSNAEKELNKCKCSNSQESEESDIEDDEEIVPLSTSDLVLLEFQEVLITELMEGLIYYFCKVHFAEKVSQLKDFVLEKPKTFQLRHTLEESKKDVASTIQFPCGICSKECIEIIHKRKASFEDFSVQCDKCDKWYHYICANLSGNEPELKENSNLPFFCLTCKTSTVNAVAEDLQEMDMDLDNSDPNEVTDNCKGRGKGSGRAEAKSKNKGRGRGRGRGRGCGRGGCKSDKSASAEVQQISTCMATNDRNISVSSRGRKRKPVKRDDFVT